MGTPDAASYANAQPGEYTGWFPPWWVPLAVLLFWWGATIFTVTVVLPGLKRFVRWGQVREFETEAERRM